MSSTRHESRCGTHRGQPGVLYNDSLFGCLIGGTTKSNYRRVDIAYKVDRLDMA